MARVGAVSLLRRTIALVWQLAPAKVIVVVPRRTSRLRHEARGFKVCFSANSRRSDGLSSSVRRGLTQAHYAAAALLLPVDLAALRQRDMLRLIGRWRAARRRVCARDLARPGETPRGGVPLILPRWLYARAQTVSGDIGLRDWVGSLPPAQRALLPLPSAALDVDTAHDLRLARRRPRRPARSV